MPAPAPSAFSPLNHPAFRLIWIASMFANLGTLIQNVGAAWLMAELTPSHDMIALVQAAATLPITLLAIPAGALADGYDRRRIMILAQCFMCAVAVLLAAIGLMGLLTPFSLLFLTFLLGLGSALYMPAWQASVRDLVPLSELPAAVALNSMSFNLMRSVGPALGGLIVASMGAPFAFALNAASFLVLIGAFIAWRPEKKPDGIPPERLTSAMQAGIRFVALSPNLLTIIARGMVFGGAATALHALMPIVTREMLHAPATVFGILLGAFGSGAIIGVLTSPRLRRRFGIERFIQIAFLVSALGMLIVASLPWLPATLLGMVISGMAWVAALSVFNVSIQLAAPSWVVGRAISIHHAGVFGSMALGAWFWGWLSEVWSVEGALLVAAATLVIGGLMGRVLSMPEFPEEDLNPSNRFNAPALKLGLSTRSGPIRLFVEWEIPAENTHEFLVEMAQRRSVRRRGGARAWALSRDLENPELWIETFRFATWSDYIRHNQRQTHRDLADNQRLRALQREGSRPKVRRMLEQRAIDDHEALPLLEHPKVI